MDLHYVAAPHDATNGRHVADKIEIELVVQGRVDSSGCIRHQQRVAIGRSPHDRLGGKIGRCSWSVFDDKWLAETLRQCLSDQTCDDIDGAAWCEPDHKAHRP